MTRPRIEPAIYYFAGERSNLNHLAILRQSFIMINWVCKVNTVLDFCANPLGTKKSEAWIQKVLGNNQIVGAIVLSICSDYSAKTSFLSVRAREYASSGWKVNQSLSDRDSVTCYTDLHSTKHCTTRVILLPLAVEHWHWSPRK